MCRPRGPHFPHTILPANDGTSTSSAYFDTAINPWCRRIVETGRNKPVHPKVAHIAERHRRAV
jgi:hypothetical protein